jgi:hypothetical protein
MMTIEFTSQFKRDYKRVKSTGYDTDKLDTVINMLASGTSLPALRKNLCKIINCDKNVRQEWPPNSHSVFYSIHSILHFVKMQCQSARWNGAERNGIGLIGGSSIRRHSFFAIILAKPLS